MRSGGIPTSRMSSPTRRWSCLEEGPSQRHPRGVWTEWTSGRDKRQAMEVLQAAGVPAGAVLNGREMLEDPHLTRREFYQPVDHPVGGRQMQRTWPFRLSRSAAEIHAPAPCLGQHTREVLHDLLGYSDQEIEALEAAGVLGSEPVRG